MRALTVNHFQIWSLIFDILLEQHFRIKNSEKKNKNLHLKSTYPSILMKDTYQPYKNSQVEDKPA